MEVSIIPIGPIETNCCVVSDEKTKLCAVIDPGDSGEQLYAAISNAGLTCKAILLTHGHHDHVKGVKALHEATGAPVYLHKADLELPESITAGPLLYTETYDEGDTVTVGDMTFEVLHTPGHTPGSVCLRSGEHLFAGDTLFLGSCGRVDLPLGSWDDMKASLRKLAELPGDYTVYPGHGPTTTLSQEQKMNPYLREATK